MASFLGRPFDDVWWHCGAQKSLCEAAGDANQPDTGGAPKMA
jgi:hypothetical protein